METRYPEALQERYGIWSEKTLSEKAVSGKALSKEAFSREEKPDPVRMLEQVAMVRSCLMKGGELDLAKAAGIVIDDFRSGKLGRITLEVPEWKGADEAKSAGAEKVTGKEKTAEKRRQQ